MNEEIYCSLGRKTMTKDSEGSGFETTMSGVTTVPFSSVTLSPFLSFAKWSLGLQPSLVHAAASSVPAFCAGMPMYE
jgi:hypothetical protein